MLGLKLLGLGNFEKMSKINENFLKIQAEIAPCTPKIVAVTKYFDEGKIIEAYEAGLRNFGEARVIEAIEKIGKLPKELRQNSQFHLIGHLQSNKVSKAVGHFDLIHSVDSLKLADRLSQEASARNLVQKVLLQLNNAGEVQKFGFSKDCLMRNFGQIQSFKGIEVVGLMNMAPLEASEDELISLFKDVAKTRDELETKYRCKLPELSMGMSGDYEQAAVAGATIIRVGRKLFS